MTLLSGLELGVLLCLSASPDSSLWRALRAARSLMALGVDVELPPLSGVPEAPPLAPRSHASPELPAGRETERQGERERGDVQEE